ncbi:MAG TPA: MerR family transcriptional regulator [Phenylobacterium sp.]|nr:MerR family transcriptional regulator [Phenylobacterium sp.]HSV03793.1 MerR family transcriptional regulator [Phenylobacterium sp.]
MRGYTVKQVAKLSGVSVRTLHHYHEVGLLKPASVGANGYRYYGQDELLRLQQILFHRELGFALEEIGKVLDSPGFDRAAALRAHKANLAAETKRYRRLMRTIDDTLAALEGETKMDGKAYYKGFDPDRAAAREAWIVEHYGEGARRGIELRNQAMSRWTQADYDGSQAEIGQITRDLVKALQEGAPAHSEHVQAIARRLHTWASRSWVQPISRTGFLGMARFYSEVPHYREMFEGWAAGLTDYMTEAMRAFAGKELA